jgi:hypothetical protein
MSFEEQLQTLRSRIDPLGRLVHAFAGTLPAPLRYHSGIHHHGFRYGIPKVEHFCLLKAARAVSALNAALELARCGYTQEIGVIMRTLAECTTHIKFVLLARDDTGTLEPKAAKYVQDYFADLTRNSAADIKRAQVSQKTVNERLGTALDSAAQRSGGELANDRPEHLESDVYLTFSNYVHAKYPEIMDLYGGIPPHFHLRGMRGTPKDAENLEIIDDFVTTTSVTFGIMVTRLNLYNLFECDAVLAEWFRSI